MRDGRGQRGRLARVELGIQLRLHRLGQAEVEDLRAALVGDPEVGGLQIAVDDAAFVGGLQSFCHLEEEWNDLVKRDRPVARDACGQVVTFDELHDEKGLRAGAGAAGRWHNGLSLQSKKRRDVRMVDRGQRLRFALEALQPLWMRRQILRQHLDRHLAPELRVARAVDLAHAARTERGDDLIESES